MAPLRKRRSQDPADGVIGAFAGEYRIERRLGAGGFGAVYAAEHPVLKRRAAVKVLHANRSLDDVAVKRFIAEAQAASQIRHRHIVDIFSFGQLANGQLFYVMDLLDGLPLDAYLRALGQIAPEVVVALLRPIAHALDALHASGAVHRDVKPGNIFLAWDAGGEVVPKLLDFGLIKLAGNAPVTTASDVLMGTPYYMAPEQCRGEAVDARSDVYALGVICHELCTGGVPFPGDSVSAVLLATVLQPPPAMSQSNPQLPVGLDAPVLAMLAKEPAQRPPTAGAAFEGLELAVREAGLHVPEAPLRLVRPEPPAVGEAAATSAGTSVRASSLGALARDASGIKRTHRASLLAWGLLAVGVIAGVALVLRISGSGRMPQGLAAPDAARAVTLVAAETGPSGATADVPAASPDKRGEEAERVAPGAQVAPGQQATTAAQPASGKPGESVPEGESAMQAASARRAETGAQAAPDSQAAIRSAASVRVLLLNAPEHATVRQGDRVLGDASGPLLVARGEAAIALTIEAEGYESKLLRVVPGHDLELDASLKKARAARPKRGRLSTDLENPFR